jgi:hypothetical protein
MPHLTFPIDRDGLVVPGLVGFNDQATAALVQANQPVPRPLAIRALLDSGCDVTAVSPDIVSHFGLTSVHSGSSQTASGSVLVKLYKISLSIHGLSGAAAPMLTYSDLLVTRLAVPLPNLDVLVGLDIIKQCLLIIDGPGDRFTLSF